MVSIAEPPELAQAGPRGACYMTLTACRLHTTLPGLPGLLTERVLAKLNLRTLQSLWQTSRACRQMLANSQDVLAAFVQVCQPGHTAASCMPSALLMPALSCRQSCRARCST